MDLSEQIGRRPWQSFKHLLGTKFELSDATTGHLRDIYFDDQSWEVRHLISDPSDRYSVQQLLVSPSLVMTGGTTTQPELFLNLSREQFADLPLASTARPVCKQYALWNTMGGGPSQVSRSQEFDPRLRSCKAIHGYKLIGPNGPVGMLDDFLIDAETWVIHQLVGRVETEGRVHTFLFSPEAVTTISWVEGAMRLKAPQCTIPPARALSALVQAA